MGLAFPKTPPRLLDKIAQKRAVTSLANTFKNAVWARDEHTCRCCRHHVIKSLELVANRGEVHHLQSRRYHQKRFDVRNGVLLCALCHSRVTAKQLFITGDDANGRLEFTS